jgi:hypothetical protein
VVFVGDEREEEFYGALVAVLDDPEEEDCFSEARGGGGKV